MLLVSWRLAGGRVKSSQSDLFLASSCWSPIWSKSSRDCSLTLGREGDGADLVVVVEVTMLGLKKSPLGRGVEDDLGEDCLSSLHMLGSSPRSSSTPLPSGD